jgi:hypothetical protein
MRPPVDAWRWRRWPGQHLEDLIDLFPALLSPEGDVFDQMAGRYNQQAGPNLGVYLKGHAGDLLKSTAAADPPNTSNDDV